MPRINTPACILSIAGTDPSGGAGIQADIKAISATGSYAASVITALVAQNTQRVLAIEEVSSGFIQQQLDAVFDDLCIDAIKIGMLHTKATIDVIAANLKKHQTQHVVLDPVMIAKNGNPLLEPHLVAYLREEMLPLCSLLTPNTHETAALLEHPVESFSDMAYAAMTLAERYQVNVLVKGGHSQEVQHASDVLYLLDSKTHHWFHESRIETKNTHGTGCSLSSAIASFLGQGYTLTDAISRAKAYLTQAIQAAATQQIGLGFGPVDHFYFLQEARRQTPVA